MWNLKNSAHKLIYKKRSRLTDIENKLVVTSRERGGSWNLGVGKWEVQTTRCKIGSRMYYTTRGIYPIFCNNYKWKVTFKNVIKFYIFL